MAKARLKSPPEKTDVPQVITVAASRCPSCRSTDREKYHNVKEMAHGGLTVDGDAYTHVVWRRTQCRACGQMRIDKMFECRNVPHRGQ